MVAANLKRRSPARGATGRVRGWGAPAVGSRGAAAPARLPPAGYCCSLAPLVPPPHRPAPLRASPPAATSTSQDWEAWEGINVADLDDVSEVAELREAVIERRRMRAGRRSKVRDEYMRPIVDPQVICSVLRGGASSCAALGMP